VAVQRWARARGFTVTGTTPWTVSLRGEAGGLASAFGTGLRPTRHKGTRFVTQRSAPTVPAALRGVADPVIGLDTRPVWHGHALYGGGDVQVLTSTPVRGSTAGAGATVATVNLSGWHPTDLTTYRRAAFGPADVAPAVTNVLVGAGHVAATAPETDFGDETEVALDAETIAGVAPAAGQRMYFGGNSSADYIAILNRMAADLLATPGLFQTASTSWGVCELDISTTELNAMRSAITQITAAGATFFAASGDSGAFGCDYLGESGAIVDFPAAAENAVAVGGTTVSGGANGYSSTTWEGSGGGCSARVAAPARQVGLSSCAGRAVPDLANVADPDTGLWVYDHLYEWVPVGGTSLASPASAAGLAVAQAHAGLSTLATPFLTKAYQTPAAFADVTTGDNGLYAATAGYDLATGLGTPQWTALEAALTGNAAPVPTGHNEPLLVVDPSDDPTTAPLSIQVGETEFASSVVPNGEPATGYAVAEGTGTTSCAVTSPLPPEDVSLSGAQGSRPLSVSMTTTDPAVPSGCISVQRSVLVDSVMPAVALPVAGYVGTTSPAYRFSWAPAADAAPSSGVNLYGVWVTDVTTGQDVAEFFTAGRTFPYPTSAPFKAVAGHGYRIEVDALDAALNFGYRTQTFLAPTDDARAALSKHLSSGRYVSDWTRAKASADYLGSHVVSSRKGASFSYRFTARTVTLGVIRGASGGYADVYLDGVKKARISLYASTTRFRQQLRVISLSARGTHTLKVVVTGLHPAASKGNAVYLDSITLAN
jgi:hypothetical protein